MKKLKPCPFCGGKAKINKMPYGDNYKVYCPKCGIAMGFTYSHIHPKTEEEAVTAWNTRSKKKECDKCGEEV